MPLFSYKSVDSRGRYHSGKLDAANETDLENRLARAKGARNTSGATLCYGQERVNHPLRSDEQL